MKTLRWATAASLLGTLFTGVVTAQTISLSGLEQPASVQRTGYESDPSGYAMSDTPAPAASPSAKPVAPAAAPAEAAQAQPCAACEEPACAGDCGPYKLFQGPWLQCHNIDIRGYIDVGYTYNPDDPVNRSNGLVGYNDRSNDFMMNQLYLITERVTQTNGCGVDIGGRVDLLYGTDHRYTRVNPGTGFDSTWNPTNLYGLSMPQMYADVAINDLIIRGGHFLAPVGYESVMPTENFFYSHTHTFLYAEPTTLSGGEAIYKLDDCLSVNAGIDTGWNNWDTQNNRLSYFFGFNWKNEASQTTFAMEYFTGNNELPGIASTRNLLNTVLTQKIGPKWTYALEVNTGLETNAFGSGNTARWNSVSNYFLYEINCCWTAGIRYEWLEDPNHFLFTGGGHINDLSVGLNWKPNKNLTVRSEIREDWAKPTAGFNTFDDFTKNNQFLWSTDVVIRF